MLAVTPATSPQSLYTTANAAKTVHRMGAVDQGSQALGSTRSPGAFMTADIRPARKPQAQTTRALPHFVGPRTEVPSQVVNPLNVAIVTALGALAYFLGRSTPPPVAMAASGGVSGDAEPNLPTTSDITSCAAGDVDGTFANKTPEDLEVMYIDALWSYYKDGKASMSDEEFDTLKMELNWQGSGFPTLHKQEVEFVEAVIAYYSGNPVLSDKEYDNLKESVKQCGRRSDVTSFLLSVKAKQALDSEAYERMSTEMSESGLKPSRKGAASTLSDTCNSLQYEVTDVLLMYSALGLVPTAICSMSWGFLGFLLGGLHGIETVATLGFPAVGASSFLLTRQMVRYLDLVGPKLVSGTCPCCQSEIRTSFFEITPMQKTEKCGSCGTILNLDAEKLQIRDAAGFTFVGDSSNKKKSVDQYLSWASGVASGVLIGSNEVSRLGGLKMAKKPKPTDMGEMIQEEIKAGIFAWAILLGYGLLGETFVGRVRGKGISIHSGVINDFCKRFNIPNGLRQKYIQTAKRNGHDLGFLVESGGLIGDGLFGKQAMAWWKEQGY
uniref:Uncharacterized protein n=1 Tax=Eutreptiella gymnastica TaxID=73025 RepID=A0A7S1N7I6_9EUGL